MKNQKVIDWFSGGMNYNDGIKLLVSITGRPNVVHTFSGYENSLSGKLCYEILKASKMADIRNWKQVAAALKSGQPIETQIQSVKVQPATPAAMPKIDAADKDIETIDGPEKQLHEYPAIVRRIVHEYASVFQERSKLHFAMSEMPESNSESMMAKRAEIFDIVKASTVRLQQLYEAKLAYDKDGTLPDEKLLYPVVEKAKSYSELSAEEIKRIKKNLQTGNSKDQRLLDYQSAERKDEKTPMPEGLKRKKLEMRILRRTKEIEKLDEILFQNADQNR